jgi:hypothetical protein
MSSRTRVRMLLCLMNSIPGLGGPCPVAQLEIITINWELIRSLRPQGRKKKYVISPPRGSNSQPSDHTRRKSLTLYPIELGGLQ